MAETPKKNATKGSFEEERSNSKKVNYGEISL